MDLAYSAVATIWRDSLGGTTSVRVPWAELAESPRKAEQLFDLMMHALYGDRVRTINGAGGDGGCDAWIEDIRQSVEFKSFTTLGRAQRAQVERSLRRAAERNPESWILVAPVHPTPGDLEWFASLQGRHPFEMVFHDVRWLETRLAEHPAIARYVLTTPHRELIDLMRELGQEQAGLLGGAPDLMARLEVLRSRVDELSPVWGMDFASRDGVDGVTVRLKPDSPPQHVVVHIDIPDGDPRGSEVAEAVAAALHYGSGTVVDPGYISHVDNDALAALHLPWEQVAMVLPDQRVTTGFPRGATLRARAADGQLGRALHLTLHYATVGARGMHVHGRDATGMLRIRLRVDRPDHIIPVQGSNVGMQLQYGPLDHRHAESVDPEALLRTLDVLDDLDRTAGMVLVLASSTEQIDLDDPDHEPTGYFIPLAQTLRDFVLIRDELGVVLTLPARWSRRDERNIAILAGLLRGEEVQMPLDRMVCHQIGTPDEARIYLEFIESEFGARIDFQMVGLTLRVAGVDVPVDPLYVAFSRARITNASDVAQALEHGDALVPVDIGPALDSTVLGRMTTLLRAEPTDTSDTESAAEG